MKEVLKSNKRVKITKAIASILLVANFVMPISCAKNSQNQAESKESVKIEIPQYRNLYELRKVELPTYQNRFDGKTYTFVDEKDVFEYCVELKYAIKEYFKNYGASDWFSPQEQKFWMDDIEYIVTAIAYRESSYRTNCINELGCGGIAGINKEQVLETLDNWLHNPSTWGSNLPDVKTSVEEVDVFNPATSLEYTYYNIGYVSRVIFQKNKKFEYYGEMYCIWDNVPFTKSNQIKLIIASHLYGIGNIVDASKGVQKDGHDINYYINSNYVQDILEKTEELKSKYKSELGWQNDFDFSR